MADEKKERAYLHELARRYLEIANLPVMKEREQRWYRHNAVCGERPIVVIEMSTFAGDLMPPPVCEGGFARRVENTLMSAIVNHEMVDDDKVVSPVFEVPLDITIQLFGHALKREYAKDADGRSLGYRDEHLIQDLEEDLPKLQHSVCRWDREATAAYETFVLDTIGDLMPVRETNHSLDWYFAPSQRVIELMGMEALMYAMIDTPEAVKALYDFIAEDMLRVLDWQEKNGALRLNTGNNYAGSGSYGFTHELPTGDPVTRKMIWGNMNSQETVSISPTMFHDFVYPSYERLAREFGLIYYGCCEPVSAVWGDIEHLPNLRKASVSPWCDQAFMGEALRGSRVIYSRKPSPNYLGVGVEFDEDAYTRHIDETLECARGCELEIIHRDIYTLSGNTAKVKQAVKIIRREIDRLWQ